MSYATQTWSADDGFFYPNTNPTQRREWLRKLAALVDSVNPTSHAITSVLTLLSASVTQGAALPPYMQLPESFDLNTRLEKLDRGILGIRHVEEPGYSAYAVLQVCSSLVVGDLRGLVEDVKELVGETDFSFHLREEGKGEEGSLAGSGSGSGSGEEGGKGKRD